MDGGWMDGGWMDGWVSGWMGDDMIHKDGWMMGDEAIQRICHSERAKVGCEERS